MGHLQFKSRLLVHEIPNLGVAPTSFGMFIAILCSHLGHFLVYG